MTDMFNTYVLFEPDEVPANTEWLKERLERGQSVLIIGSGESARTIAETLGITFEEVTTKRGASVLSFTDEGRLGLSGTLPVSGKIFSPRKKGALTAAVDQATGRPVGIVDTSRKGRLVVLPVSFSHSAFKGGTTSLYSLAVRTTALSIAPEKDGSDGPFAAGFSVASRAGQTRVRIREALPPGAAVLWTSAEGKAGKDSIEFEVTAGAEPKTIQYLYQRQDNSGNPSAELFSECSGTFVSRGKM
jgi:hypothetical protein